MVILIGNKVTDNITNVSKNNQKIIQRQLKVKQIYQNIYISKNKAANY